MSSSKTESDVKSGGRWILVEVDAKASESSSPPLLSEIKENAVESKSALAVVALSARGVRSAGSRGKKVKTLKGDMSSWNAASQSIPHMKYIAPDNKPFKFIQSVVNTAFLTQTAVGFVAVGQYFFLGMLDQVSTFVALFDQYRITEVEVWIQPRNVRTVDVSTSSHGLLYSVVDYDDASVAAWSSINFREYSNCLITPADNGHYRRFKPHIAGAAYSGAFTSFSNQTDQWVDCASQNVQFYGFKVGVDASDIAGDSYTYNQEIRYHVEFRNVR